MFPLTLFLPSYLPPFHIHPTQVLIPIHPPTFIIRQVQSVRLLIILTQTFKFSAKCLRAKEFVCECVVYVLCVYICVFLGVNG